MESIQQHIDNLLNSEIGKAKEKQISSIALRKIIYQFDMDNNIVKTYPSITSWEKEFGLNGNQKKLMGLQKCRGYYFSPDPNFIIPKETKKNIDKREAVQLIKDGVVMYEFDSVREAQEFLQVNKSTINDVVNGRQKTCRGYIVKKK
jgi:hypothetical protein